MNILSIFLQAPGGSNGTVMLVYLVAFAGIFYFFMIRPQMKKAKTEKAFRESLQKGAKVVTIGGIHGRIIEVQDRTFMIEIDTNVKVKVEKTAVAADATKSLESNQQSLAK